MQKVKQARINEEMRLALSQLLRKVKDPRVSGLLSILKVEVTNDLSYAKVYVSSMEGLEGAKNAVKGLTSASGFLRRELSSMVNLRKSPELRFIPDDSIAYSAGRGPDPGQPASGGEGPGGRTGRTGGRSAVKVSLEQAAEILRAHDRICLLCHQNPDGDTLGSAYGLYYALKGMGKEARVCCAGPGAPGVRLCGGGL